MDHGIIHHKHRDPGILTDHPFHTFGEAMIVCLYTDVMKGIHHDIGIYPNVFTILFSQRTLQISIILLCIWLLKETRLFASVELKYSKGT